MSIEEISGGEGEQEDLKKLLKEYEKDLQEAKKELKQRDEEIRLKNEEIIRLKMHERNRLKDEDGDEVKVKHECDVKNRKDLEERDTFIKHLNDKMNNNVKIKQMTAGYTHTEKALTDNVSTDKDSQITELVKRVYSLEKELKEQIKKSDEKLEEELKKCREKMELANKKAIHEMEEKLQQVQLRETANHNNNSEVVILQQMVMDRFAAMEQNLQKVSIVMEKQAEAIQEGLHDTKRQVSYEMSEMKDEMNETTKKMTKKMEEQEAAIRDEVQSTKQELKDEMVAKIDEQTQKINELKSDVQEAINPAPEPKEEITYSPCEVDKTPHHRQTSQCVLSSSSANGGIDSIPAQENRESDKDGELV